MRVPGTPPPIPSDRIATQLFGDSIMSTRPASEVAARLNKLHRAAFAGSKKQPLLRISRDDFYRVADLEQLKGAKYRAIAEQLLSNHSLILGRAAEFFTLAPTSLCARWTLLARGEVSRELRRRPPGPNAPEALSPAAAWPFPTGSEP